jgi:hypothetical protein
MGVAMITGIGMTNFMGVENDYYYFSSLRDGTGRRFPARRVQITGDTGTGKTRLLKALIFAFTGRSIAGDIRPHTLITKGEKEASVRVVGDDGFEIVRTIDHSRRVVGTQWKCTKYNKTLVGTDVYKKGVGYSADMFLSSAIPGYFMSMDVARRSKVYMEHAKMAGTMYLPSDINLQNAFQCRIVDKQGISYDAFGKYTRHKVDMSICSEFQRVIDQSYNRHRFIFLDDADLCHWSDIALPSDVQVFVTKRVVGMDLKILY